jgi:Lipocalin-like domain
MNKFTGMIVRVCILVSVMAGAMLSGASTTWAQQQAESKPSQLIGHWTLTSLTLDQGGKTIDMYGPNPQGLFIFDPSGRYSIIIVRRGIPKFASGNKETGTTEENRAAVQGNLSHYGTYVVNEKEGSYTLNIDASSYPNYTGTSKRLFAVTGDELRITNPTPTTGSAGSTLMVLKRLK